MDRVSFDIIGRVRNGRTLAADHGWGSVESRVELTREYAAGLLGLDQFSHALIVFHMHLDPDGEPVTLRRRPRGRDDMPLLGVFAQRSRMRPNPIGVSVVEVVRLDPDAAFVRGLDALDGTPVLDIKPYAPVFDLRPDARVPEWITLLMKGYF